VLRHHSVPHKGFPAGINCTGTSGNNGFNQLAT
jgi:hypothetical protein